VLGMTVELLAVGNPRCAIPCLAVPCHSCEFRSTGLLRAMPGSMCLVAFHDGCYECVGSTGELLFHIN